MMIIRKRNSSILIQLIYFILVFGSIFLSFFTVRYMGYFGRAFLNTAVFLLAIPSMMIFRKVYINRFIRTLWLLTVYLLIITIVALLIQYLFNGTLENSSGLNMGEKAVSESLYWLNTVLYVVLFYNCIIRLSTKQMLRPFVFTFIFLFVWLIIELNTMPNAFWAYHRYSMQEMEASRGFLRTSYDRVRLTTTESSMTIPLIFTFGGISIYYYNYVKRNKYLAFFMLIILAVFIGTSDSKTLFLILPCAVMVFVSTFVKKRYRIISLIAAVLLIISSLYVIDILSSKFAEAPGTFTTRGLKFPAVFIHFLKYPLGVGFGIYTDTYPAEILNVIEYLKNFPIFGTLLTNELIKSTALTEVTAGGGIFTLGLFWGIFGTAIFIYALVKQYGDRKYIGNGVWLLNLLYICIIALLVLVKPYTNNHISWAAIVIVGYMKRQVNANETLKLTSQSKL